MTRARTLADIGDLSAPLTVTTAAQPNITSVGTLTGLTVSNTTTISAASPELHLIDTTNNTDAIIRSNNNGDIVFEADENGERDNTIIRFDVDGSEKMRMDTSGNLLVGGHSEVNPQNQSSGSGSALRADGRGLFRSTNANPLAGNRIGNDGEVVRISKNGTMLGALYTFSNEIALVSGNTGLYFDDPNNRIQPLNASGGVRDNTIDLGASNSRFKNLYLSGGVYLGGTGSVNYLDDYEKGSWTPNVQKGGSNIASPNSATGYYILVGEMCHFAFYWYKTGVTTSGSDLWSVGPVPFNMRAGSSNSYQHIHVGYHNTGGDRTGNGNHRWQANASTYFYLYGPNSTTNVSNQSVEFSGAGVVRLS